MRSFGDRLVAVRINSPVAGFADASHRRKKEKMTESYRLVREAILSRRQVVATYDGCRREMCPHVIGEKEGHDAALFFQFSGESNSGLPPNGQWRCIWIDNLSDVEVRDGDWHTGSGHSKGQTCVDLIDVEVDY